MNVKPVDERDSCWEDYSPRFRVYVYDESGRLAMSDGSFAQGYSTSTWDITEADMLDVLRWAQDTAGERGLFSVALVADGHGANANRGLVWLVGMDYQDTALNERERQVKAQMLSRRGQALIKSA